MPIRANFAAFPRIDFYVYMYVYIYVVYLACLCTYGPVARGKIERLPFPSFRAEISGKEGILSELGISFSKFMPSLMKNFSAPRSASFACFEKSRRLAVPFYPLYGEKNFWLRIS